MITNRYTCFGHITLLIRFYLDREPTDEDLERIECVITDILAHTSSNDQIRDIEDEAIFTKEKMADLDVLDGVIYARREYSLNN